MNRMNWRFLAILALALALVAAACGGDDDDETATTEASGGTETTAAAGGDDGGGDDGEPLKVAFVHVGPVADKGWSWAHDQGAEYLKANANVDITTLESIPEGSDSQRVFEDLAADGNMLIFGTSFGYICLLYTSDAADDSALV